ncbi:methionyl-tRNA formyltransferase [Planktothrix mougeotii]|uniref:Methionyl-tRNA formyltransferase n=1 Tax=Planktothrix mougeotii LEGE 06226 TaxID=1828728 RepID=A0ABR9UFD0_9CYAN|nr:methionyl-tRNA formyltransferase [Planktothrix mougeotii]MBE9145165.1 methionyl-tRNA formyltransferase [Planktothrix mougeotii LEGE 06226]
MKIVFFGTPQFAVPTLERLLDHPEFDILAVVTQPDKRRGRGSQLTPSPVKILAETHQLSIWQPKRVKKDQNTLNLLREAQADVFVVVAYGQILSPEILDMPRLGCVNGHGSILPKYRGAAPIQWCLYHGEEETGMTSMLMDAGMDTGPMLLKAVTPIGLLENATDLGQRLAQLGADLLVETLVKLDRGEIQPIPQDQALATYAPLIKDQDYHLDWHRSAIALHHQIRGFYPNCITSFRDKPMKVCATVPLIPEYQSQFPLQYQNLQQQWPYLSQLSGQPGEVVALVKRFGPVVQTGAGLLLLTEVQLAGKRVQSGLDFANGTRLAVGEILG